MGRIYRTRTTVKEAQRMELRWILDKGYLSKGRVIQSSLSWSNGSTIGIVSTHLEGEISIELSYRVNGREMRYKIYLVAEPSNLGKGKGEILYFVCPKTGKRCRILYRAYGSPIFMSRGAYNYKLYYELQTSSRLQRDNTRYFNLESRLSKLYQMREAYKYKGKLTKRAKLIRILEDKRSIADARRWDQLLNWIDNNDKP